MATAGAAAIPMPISPPGSDSLNRLWPGAGGAGTAALNAARVGAQALPGALQGFGLGVGYRASSILGKIGNFLLELIMSWEPYDTFVKMAALVYIIDIFIGFDPAFTIPMHLIFAWVMFFLIGIMDSKKLNLSIWTYVWVSILFFYMFQVINGGVGFLTRVSVTTLPFALAFIFYFGLVPRFSNKPPMPLFGIPIVAAIDVFALNIFRQSVTDWAGNFSILAGVVAFLLGRLVNPLMLIYGAMFMNEESKLAKKVLAILIIVYLTAAIVGTFGHVAKLRGATGLTSEEISQGTNLLQSSAKGIVNLVSLRFINPSVAYAYEKAERTFGFGEPKQEPKLGLTLVQDSTMLRKYDLGYKEPEPGFIMRIPNPFPAYSKSPLIEVTEIKCNENSGKKLAFVKAVTDEQFIFNPAQKNTPVEVYYSGSRGGNAVKCLFTGWQAGEAYNIEAEVTYNVENSAYLSTTFMRADFLRGLRLKPDDPKAKAVLDAIPAADAKYDNVHVAVTWGPEALSNAPVPVDLSRIGNNMANLAITVYVAKNPAWENSANSEIKSVKSLSLTVPKGVKLVGSPCDFDLGKAKAKDDGSTEYPVLDAMINEKAGGKPRLIGDAIRFDCGMTVTADALGEKDTASARFDVSGSFEVTIKLKGISFTVENSKAATQPAQQLLQEKCAATGGTWKATATPPTCDCGDGKKWDQTGCVPSSAPPAPAQPLPKTA